MKGKICLVLSLLICTTMVLAACSGQPSSSAGTSTQPASGSTAAESTAGTQSVNRRVIWWGSQTRNDKTLKVIEMYKDENPNVTIQPEYLGWDGYWEKLSALAAASSLPDVIQQDYNYLESYAKKGLLLPLDEYVKSGVLDLSDCDEVNIAGGRVGDKLYGVNLGTGGMVLIYDPEILSKAGVAEPTPEWTYDDYIAAMLKVKEKLNIYGAVAFNWDSQRGVEVYARQYGQKYYTADGKKIGFEPKIFADYYKMSLQLVQAGVLPSPDVRSEIKSIEDDFIAKGKGAFSILNSNQIVAIANAAGKPLKMALIPNAKDQTDYGLYMKPSMLFSIGKDTSSAEEAAKFISYFTNSIDANKVLQAERGVPISQKVQEGIMDTLGDEQKDMFKYIQMAAKYTSPIDPPQPAGHAEVVALQTSIEQQILFGRITPEAAAEKFIKEANAILAKN